MKISKYLNYFRLKLAINLGTDPTIVNPAEYYERFIKAM